MCVHYIYIVVLHYVCTLLYIVVIIMHVHNHYTVEVEEFLMTVIISRAVD